MKSSAIANNQRPSGLKVSCRMLTGVPCELVTSTAIASGDRASVAAELESASKLEEIEDCTTSLKMASAWTPVRQLRI